MSTHTEIHEFNNKDFDPDIFFTRVMFKIFESIDEEKQKRFFGQLAAMRIRIIHECLGDPIDSLEHFNKMDMSFLRLLVKREAESVTENLTKQGIRLVKQEGDK